jgi:hypothetical protein
MTLSQFKRCYKGVLARSMTERVPEEPRQEIVQKDKNFNKDSLMLMKVGELKEISKKLNIKTGGKKIELIERILEVTS